MYGEGLLDKMGSEANAGNGAPKALSKGLQPEDPFGTAITQFYLGIFTECVKSTPVPGNIARSYLRIAWLYRDAPGSLREIAAESGIKDVLEEAEPVWAECLPPNSNYPLPPGIATDEVGALRYTMAFFEWNFRSLSSSGYEDEMRLMALIAEIGYRLYELTNDDEDFQKGQTLFSGSMQKCLSVINDKTIVGGAVNKAKESLDKAGDRGRELRLLKARRDKGQDLPTDPVVSPLPAVPQNGSGTSAPETETEGDVADSPAAAAPEPEPAMPAAPEGSLDALKQKITQMDTENKRWMRLAGISEITGLPNKVMLSRVLLPGALKQAISHREPLGCILVSPEGMREINGKFGRSKGDILLKQISECLKGLLKRGERLANPDGANFLVIVPALNLRQLRKRAETLHKDLTSRRFDLDGAALSMEARAGVFGFESYDKGNNAKVLQEALYTGVVSALDTAKVSGTPVEVGAGQS
jgi:diguanylate cyclase (GGDEF)-like protein